MLLGSACENNSDTTSGADLAPRESFYITPSGAELRPAQQQLTLTVVGGEAPFTWSVESDILGTIASVGDRSAVYTRRPLVRGVNTVTVRDSTVLVARTSVIQD